MPLAPRHTTPQQAQRANPKTAGVGDATRQRQTSRAKNGTASGSTNDAVRVSRLPPLDWSEVAEEVVHLTDVAAKLSHSQIGASGWVTATLNIPLAYAHSLIDIQQHARDGLVYFRAYYVPFTQYLDAVGWHEDGKGVFQPGPDPRDADAADQDAADDT